MTITAIALGGLNQAQARLDQTARRLASTPEAPPGDMVSLLSARDEFATNIKVLKTAGEMERQAIDLLG